MKRWLRHGLVLGAMAFLGMSPLLLAMLAGAFAQANGCTLHEGYVNPCVVGGRDWGPLLYNLGVGFWWVFFTGPLGMLAMGLYGLAVLVRRFAVRTRK
jgi:hypothetical protein